jgi:hypothetical protein
MVGDTHAEAVFRSNDHTCFYCGTKVSISFEMWYHCPLARDHRIPKSSKGAKDVSNLVTSCSACNGYKGNRLFQSPEDAKFWIHLYREFVSKPYYERIVINREPGLWKINHNVNDMFIAQCGYSPEVRRSRKKS